MAVQGAGLTNAFVKAKKASIHGYIPLIVKDEEEIKEEECKANAISAYDEQKRQINKTKVLREFLSGFKFSFRLDSITVCLFPMTPIRKAH